MYARLVEVEGVDPSKREASEATVRDTVVPALKGMDGFAGFILLIDEESGRARSVALWETEEAAQEAERQIQAKREEAVRTAGGTIRSADLFEAPIVEVLAGARA